MEITDKTLFSKLKLLAATTTITPGSILMNERRNRDFSPLMQWIVGIEVSQLSNVLRFTWHSCHCFLNSILPNEGIQFSFFLAILQWHVVLKQLYLLQFSYIGLYLPTIPVRSTVLGFAANSVHVVLILNNCSEQVILFSYLHLIQVCCLYIL